MVKKYIGGLMILTVLVISAALVFSAEHAQSSSGNHLDRSGDLPGLP